MDDTVLKKLKKDCKKIFGVGFIFRGNSAFEIQQNITQFLNSLPMETVRNYRGEVGYSTLQSNHLSRIDTLLAILISTIALAVSSISAFKLSMNKWTLSAALILILALYTAMLIYVIAAVAQIDHRSNRQFILNCIDEYISSQS